MTVAITVTLTDRNKTARGTASLTPVQVEHGYPTWLVTVDEEASAWFGGPPGQVLGSLVRRPSGRYNVTAFGHRDAAFGLNGVPVTEQPAFLSTVYSLADGARALSVFWGMRGREDAPRDMQDTAYWAGLCGRRPDGYDARRARTRELRGW